MRKFILVFLLVLSACTTTRNRETYFQEMDAWINQNADNLVLAYGPPTSVYELSTHEKIFQYEDVENQIMRRSAPLAEPMPRFGVRTMYPHDREMVMQKKCVTRFKISKDNYVISWSSNYDKVGRCN